MVNHHVKRFEVDHISVRHDGFPNSVRIKLRVSETFRDGEKNEKRHRS